MGGRFPHGSLRPREGRSGPVRDATFALKRPSRVSDLCGRRPVRGTYEFCLPHGSIRQNPTQFRAHKLHPPAGGRTFMRPPLPYIWERTHKNPTEALVIGVCSVPRPWRDGLPGRPYTNRVVQATRPARGGGRCIRQLRLYSLTYLHKRPLETLG